VPKPVSLDSILGDPGNFSLVLGGPLFQLLRWGHLSDDASRTVMVRITVFVLLAWLPLLVLSALDGHLQGGRLTVPFLADVDVHVRFLVAMPLLVGAELLVHQRMRPIMQLFLNRRLMPDSAVTRFREAIASALRLRNSVITEVLLIAFVYIVGVTIVWHQYVALGTATWYATPSSGGTTLTLAGIWYGYLSLPLVQFLMCRWYFRVLIWTRLLWLVSRIDLRLLPAHPDRVGGLGFISNAVYAFAPVAAAHGALLAGLLANRIFFAGAALTDFKAEIGVVVVFMLCLTLVPPLVFAPQLARAKRMGMVRYGHWLNAMSERSIRNGQTVARLPMSSLWEAPISSRSPISQTMSRWYGPCVSCR
jgi:hypothetical protein